MSHRSIRTLIAGRPLVTTSQESTVAVAARLMKKKNVGAVLILEHDGGLAGIFTERDALFRVMAEGRDPKDTRISQVMTAHPRTIDPDRPFEHALLMMHDGGFRHVPVVEHGHPIGVISARDALGPELQEFDSEIERRNRIQEILG